MSERPRKDQEAFFAGYGAFGQVAETYHLGYSEAFGVFFSDWMEALVSNVLLDTGQWHHIAVTNKKNVCYLFIDGKEIANNYYNLNTPSDSSFFIGSIKGDDMRFLVGRVEDVKIYDSALSPSQIKVIYDSAKK